MQWFDGLRRFRYHDNRDRTNEAVNGRIQTAEVQRHTMASDSHSGVDVPVCANPGVGTIRK